MSKWIRRIIFAVVTLLILSIVGIAVFFLTFDPNTYKDKLQDFVYQRYERHLEIQGEISLSLFPRIGLSVQGVQLSEKGSDVPFAAVDKMRFSVAVWPLLWNRLVVDHLFLDGVQAWFEFPSTPGDWDESENTAAANVAQLQPPQALSAAPVDQSMIGRWAEHLIAPVQAQAQVLEETVRPRVQRSEFQIDIAGAEIHGANLYFFDTYQRWSAELRDLSLNTGRITFEQPFDVSMKGRLYSEAFGTDLRLDGQGVLQVDSTAQRLIVHRSHLHSSGMAGPFKVENAELQGTAEYLFEQALDIEQLDLNAQGHWMRDEGEQAADLQFNAKSIGVHWDQAQLWWENLNLRSNAGAANAKTEIGLQSEKFWISPSQAEGAPIVASFKHAHDQDVSGFTVALDGFTSGWREFKADEVHLEGRYQTPRQQWDLQFDSALFWSHEDEQLIFSDGQGKLSLTDDALAEGQSARLLSGDFYIEPFNGHAAGALEGRVIKAATFASVQDDSEEAKADEDNVEHTDSEDPSQQELPAAGTVFLDGQNTAGEVNERLNWFFWFDKANTPPSLITHLEAEQIDLTQWIPALSFKTKDAREPSPATQADQQTLEAQAKTQTELGWIKLPFEWSWRIEAKGLHAENLWLQDFNAHGKWQRRGLEVSEMQAKLYDGRLRAHAAWVDSDQFYGYLDLSEVNTAALLAGLDLPGFLQGKGNIEASWHTWGTTLAAWRAGLNARVQAQFEGGAFIGFSAWEQIDAANEVVKQRFSTQAPAMPEAYDENAVMAFDTAKLELQGENGQLQFTDFLMKGPHYKVILGEPAWIDLVNDQLDLVLLVDLDLPKEDAAASSDEGASARHFDSYYYDFAQESIPLRVTGALQAPEMRMQWADMRHRLVQSLNNY